MTRATPIAIMVEAMLASGAAHSAIGDAVAAAGLQGRSKIPHRNLDRRGSRLADDWQPTEADISYAIGRGMSRERMATESERFRNYWHAKSGQAATKRDWGATWRNWILSALERTNGP